MTHTVVAVLIDDSGEPHFRCACSLVFSGKAPRTWAVTLSSDGKLATFSPSVYLPDHLHEYSSNVPVVRTWMTLALRPEFHATIAEACDDDCACRTVEASA